MCFFSEIALPLAERGFRVFPLIPKDKAPLKMSWGDHFDAASMDAGQLRAWGTQEPNANVGISPDEIFCFLETDDEAALKAVCADLPPEVWDTARVSARDNRCYYIFRQTMRTKRAGNMTATREGQDNLFEFKQHRMYVTGPGSIHPKTGKPYGVEWRTIPAMPDVLLNRLCELHGAPKASESHAMSEETKRQTELLDRFLDCYEVATTGDWFNKGKQWYRPIECPWRDEHENQNEGTSTCIVYTEGGGYGFDCKHRCASKGWKEFRAELEGDFGRKFSFVEPEPVPVLGGTEPEGKKVMDWRELYHSFDELNNAPPVTFLIEGFLTENAITAIAAPVAQRKSLIALNVAHALLTGEKLFGQFPVIERPSRVLYLCPEMGIQSFSDRLKRIGLMEYVGKTLFCRTMASGTLGLEDLTPEQLSGAVVILDTAIRFLNGDENKSEDMRRFAESIFRVMKDGAASVVLLHHSVKGTKDSGTLTLDNAMRGSGELAAFVASCWATRLQNPDEPYASPSYLVNVKQRDFESKPFEVTSGADCRLHIVSEPGTAVLKTKTSGNRDGKEDEAIEFIRNNPDMPLRQVEAALKDKGIKRGTNWISKKRALVCARGVTLTEGA